MHFFLKDFDQNFKVQKHQCFQPFSKCNQKGPSLFFLENCLNIHLIRIVY
jgi:hypothetical protein